MYCICCKKDNVLTLLYGEEKVSEEDYIWVEEERVGVKGKVNLRNTNSRMWDNGIVHIIDAGYGSSHDTDQYVIAICDDCIAAQVAEGNLLYYGNYMSKYGVKELVSESKKIFKRKKNLDNFTEETNAYRRQIKVPSLYRTD